MTDAAKALSSKSGIKKAKHHVVAVKYYMQERDQELHWTLYVWDRNPKSSLQFENFIFNSVSQQFESTKLLVVIKVHLAPP